MSIFGCRSLKRLGVAAVIFLSLACSLVAPPVTSTPSPTKTIPPPKPTRVEPTTEPVSVDNIEISYVYTESLATAYYHLYGTVLDDFVDITVTNGNEEPVTVVVETEVVGYTSPSKDTVIIDPGDPYEIHQNPLLLPEAVEKLNSQKPANFHIRVVLLKEGEERVVVDETKQILVFSRRDYIWLQGFNAQENFELWGVWVTPNDPAVEALIRAAADFVPGDIMVNGYGGEEHDASGSVRDRLEAIWNAEEQVYHLIYISTMTTFAPGATQRMRFPAEVLEQKSGNCVELVTLYAAAAEALKLETAIIRIPGHAFLAVRSDEVNADYYYIETTLIGRSTFREAMASGYDKFYEVMPHIEAGDDGYAWVTIPETREKGILPMPWR